MNFLRMLWDMFSYRSAHPWLDKLEKELGMNNAVNEMFLVHDKPSDGKKSKVTICCGHVRLTPGIDRRWWVGECSKCGDKLIRRIYAEPEHSKDERVYSEAQADTGKVGQSEL